MLMIKRRHDPSLVQLMQMCREYDKMCLEKRFSAMFQLRKFMTLINSVALLL